MNIKPLIGMVLALGTGAWSAEPAIQLPESVYKLDLSAAEGIPILSGGRVKPLLVAATEGTQGIRGRAGLTRDLGPMRSWFALALYGDTLSRQPVVFCANKPLRTELGLDPSGQFASFEELASSDRLRQLTETADAKDREKIRLTALEKAARETARRLEKFAEARAGTSWRLLPGPVGREGLWRLPQEIPAAEMAANPALLERTTSVRDLLLGFAAGDQARFDSAARKLSGDGILIPALSNLGDGEHLRTRPGHVHAELFLVHLRPFRWAWVLLMLGFLAAWVAQSSSKTAPDTSRRFTIGAVVCTGLAFVLLVAGFALRVYVSGRAPVTNMYETTLWVGFGAILFGLPIAWIYRSRSILAAVLAAGWVVFVLADNLPTVLDPAIKPLVPVLRNNFWLTLHVLTVTISYAAFLVAMAIGNLGLAQAFRKDSKEFQKDLSHYAYRAMQLGVLLLIAGIILGGVWADYSWGRFWGWDPKETWSLIAALGYLMVLHGRFSGWVRVFGTLMGSVLAFFGVIMAWYGVNFILASGLHSYGFSEGGAAAMGVFVAVQGSYALVCYQRHRRNKLGAAGGGSPSA
jgi:ABC-type transport system involved in cytochrome c biogenesis permease subunit